MENKNKIKLVKIIVTIIVIAVLGIFLWQIAPLILKLSTHEGQIAFKDKINSMGFRGVLMLFGLQIVQILLVILPGEPFEVLAGMCYGAWGGYLFTVALLIGGIWYIIALQALIARTIRMFQLSTSAFENL